MQCPIQEKEYDQNIGNHVEQGVKRLFPFEEDTVIDNRVKKLKIHSNKILAETESSSTSEYNCTKHTEVQSSGILDKKHILLIKKLRPTNIAAYVGQKQVIGPGTVLNDLLKRKEIPSMIFWGPHGCGKKSLTNVIACLSKKMADNNVHIINLCAANCGVKDVRNAVTVARDKSKLDCKTIVVMDEIHRFNKLQQDIFLPHVEAGIFILIGCTTENPSYSLNPALLSRCRVFMLKKLTEFNLREILHRAIECMNGSLLDTQKRKHVNTKEQIGSYSVLNPKFYIDNSTVQWLAEASDGDARVALRTFELTVVEKEIDRGEVSENKDVIVALKDVQKNLMQTHMFSEKESNQSHHMYSALHKSIRAGKANASLYWITRIMAVKEDPVNIARRLVRISSEDIGLADPDALGVAVHTMYGCQMIGMPECDVLLGQCTVYLAKAPKSRSIYNALRAAEKVISEYEGPQLTAPLHTKCNSAEAALLI